MIDFCCNCWRLFTFPSAMSPLTKPAQSVSLPDKTLFFFYINRPAASKNEFAAQRWSDSLWAGPTPNVWATSMFSFLIVSHSSPFFLLPLSATAKKISSAIIVKDAVALHLAKALHTDCSILPSTYGYVDLRLRLWTIASFFRPQWS